MKKALVPFFIAAIILIMSSCGGERNYYHNRNGHVRHVKAKKYAPWYTTNGSTGYDKYTRHTIRRWDKSLR